MGWVGSMRLRRLGWREPPAGGGLFPQGFVALQSKVLTFSFVAPCREGKWLAALPLRVLQRAPCLSPICHHGQLLE
ncbi:MAG: hypothetical protein DVB22_003233 [Verrucomicrobia bacterium]|nr:MAG: hypothetical protein DVB22_003233 [Verrucomicrobiota bacterium]